MIAMYVIMIQRGLKTIGDVPESIREKVKAVLDVSEFHLAEK